VARRAVQEIEFLSRFDVFLPRAAVLTFEMHKVSFMRLSADHTGEKFLPFAGKGRVPLPSSLGGRFRSDRQGTGDGESSWPQLKERRQG
jgi:hypothetical protein